MLTDLLRYIEPSVGIQRGYSGQSRDIVSFGWRDSAVEKTVITALNRRYEGTSVSAPGAHTLAVYQNLFRVDRLWIVLSLLSVFAAGIAARGPLRLGVLLFGGCALGLYVLPVLTLSYDFRYGMPPGVLLAIGGVLGVVALMRRVRERPTTRISALR